MWAKMPPFFSYVIYADLCIISMVNELKVKSEMWSVPAIIQRRITDKLEQKLQEQRRFTMLLLIPLFSQSHICGMG